MKGKIDSKKKRKAWKEKNTKCSKWQKRKENSRDNPYGTLREASLKCSSISHLPLKQISKSDCRIALTAISTV